MYFTKEKLCGIIEHIKKKHPDCAITLSVGERDYKDYLAWYESGADRYLYAMRLLRQNIIISFIQQRCHQGTERNAYGSLKI